MVIEILALVVMVLVIIVIILVRKINSLEKSLESLEFGKKSLSVKYGKMSEQFFPFLKEYPHNPENFRFLGTPIDGVQFEKDKVVLVEFKTGDSHLSAKQKEVKELVEKGKVEFKEVKIK